MKGLRRLLFASSLLLIFQSLSLAQSANFVGLSESQIRLLIGNEFKLKLDKGENGLKFLSGVNGAYSWVFLLDDDNVCYVILIIPDSTPAMNGLVKYYNDRAVAVSSTEWKMYTQDRILNIKLDRLKFGDPTTPLTFLVSTDDENK